MKKFFRNFRIKKLMLSLVFVFISFIFIKSAVYLSAGAFAQKAALLSASVIFPEGGLAFIHKPPEGSITSGEIPVNADDNDNHEPDGKTENSQTENLESESSKSVPEPSAVNVPAEASSNSVSSALTAAQIAVSGVKKSGMIIREFFTPGKGDRYIPLKNNAYIKNDTKIANSKIIGEMNKKPDLKMAKGKEPQVLIYHTHATESYEMTSRDFYDSSYNSRTKDNNLNVVRVGAEIQAQLEEAGIAVIHDVTLHDSPSYNGSYERSAQTIKKALKQYPSIKVIIDVHRDAITRDGGVRVAPTATIGGKKAAQLMIISGADNGTMNYPDFYKNLRFSRATQEQLESDYPGLTRPLSVIYRKYNQDLCPNAFLLEVGGHANSLDEAIYSGQLFGNSLAKLLKQY